MRKFISFAVSAALVIAFALLARAQVLNKAQLGRELFHDPTFKGTIDPSKATGLTCANCHADFDETLHSDGVIRAGHSVVGAHHRVVKYPEISVVEFARAAAGATFCYQHFLQRVPIDKVKRDGIPIEHAEALMSYFEVISGDNEGPQFEIVLLDEDGRKKAGEEIAAMSGDASRGWQLFGRACVTCHPAVKKAGIGPQLIRSSAPGNIDETMVRWASQIRSGGSLMPFYAPDILSDQDIADILAFLRGEIENTAE